MGIFSFGKKGAQASSRDGERRRSSRPESSTESRSQGRGSPRAEDDAMPRRRTRLAGVGQETLLDPTLPEKQRARRRLVGAIALVLAAVIVLPMVLDSHPKPATGDISVSIPERPSANARAGAAAAAPGSVRTGRSTDDMGDATDGAAALDAPPPAATGRAPGSTAVAPVQPPAAAKVTADAKPGQKNAAPGVTPGATRNDAARNDAAGHGGGNGNPGSTPSAGKSVNAGAGGKTVTGASASPARDAALPATPATPGSRYAVQLGAFGSDTAANDWVAKLKTIGVPAYLDHEKLADGHTRVVLRAGPFADRDTAQAAVAKVRRAGLYSPTPAAAAH